MVQPVIRLFSPNARGGFKRLPVESGKNTRIQGWENAKSMEKVANRGNRESEQGGGGFSRRVLAAN